MFFIFRSEKNQTKTLSISVGRLIIPTQAHLKSSDQVFTRKLDGLKERISLMSNPELNQLNIEISASDATVEDIDWLTRQLLSELRELDVESAQLTGGGTAPAGAKGDPISIGSIALELLPSVLPSVLGLVQAWLSRGQGRTVKFKGLGIEFEGSSEDLHKLIETLSRGNNP